jgi:hypothetical protein
MPNPSGFTQDIADAICERIADGESLRSICLEGGMPTKTMVMRWLGKPEFISFRDQYARAREIQADALFDEMLDICDDGSNDWMDRKFGGKIERVTDPEALQRSRLRIDTRKWIAGKLQPKKYGERQAIDQTIANPDGSSIEHKTVIILPDNGRD